MLGLSPGTNGNNGELRRLLNPGGFGWYTGYINHVAPGDMMSNMRQERFVLSLLPYNFVAFSCSSIGLRLRLKASARWT